MKTRVFCHKLKSLFSTVLVAMVLFVGGCDGGAESESEVEQWNLSDTSSHFSATLVEEALKDHNLEDIAVEEQRIQLIDAITHSRQNAITTAVKDVSPAVVSVTVTEVMDGRGAMQDDFIRFFFGHNIEREFTSMGSGFIISEDGLIVTNQHVVGKNAKEIVVANLDGDTYDAKLIGSDELTDIALLKIESDGPFPFVEFSDSDEVIVGEWALAMGNPFGLFEDGQPAVTVGVVSAKNRDFRPDPNYPRVYMDMIQTDAAINQGNSGGPLLNSEGKVIGVNTFIYTGGTSAGFVGLSFAIPSNRVERIINQLLTAGEVVLDYDPGMKFTSMTEPLIHRYRLPYIQGLLVTSVNKNGPALESGVMPGDIILRIGDERVLSKMHAWALMREYKVGDTMELELLRDGEPYYTEMLLRKRVTQEE